MEEQEDRKRRKDKKEMAKAYTLDLREKVISFIIKGGEKREAARIFGIGEDTIYRWMRSYKAKEWAPKKRIAPPPKVEAATLRSYGEEYNDQTLKEIGAALGVGPPTVLKWLKRLGITRKKRVFSRKKAAQKFGLNFKNS